MRIYAESTPRIGLGIEREIMLEIRAEAYVPRICGQALIY